MESFQALLDGLVAHPTAAMLVLSLLALAYFYKAREADAKAYIETIRAMEASHRETLLKVIPVTEKLTESVLILERLMSKGDH